MTVSILETSAERRDGEAIIAAAADNPSNSMLAVIFRQRRYISFLPCRDDQFFLLSAAASKTLAGIDVELPLVVENRLHDLAEWLVA